jgi:carbamate kinase
MRVVLALGGNALLRRGEPLTVEAQRENLQVAASAIAEVSERHEVVLTHGNGPQIGLLALQSAAYTDGAPIPLDVLGAESEGMIGYMLEQELLRHVRLMDVATLLTQVVVDPADPAFQSPTKPIGPVMNREEAEEAARERGWATAPDGDGFRRVVPSPAPQRILPARTIRRLVDAGTLVISAGGGGIPVVRREGGGYRGVEAVIDKDRTAALLARQVGAQVLVMLTDVPNVLVGYGTPDARPLGRVTPDELESHDYPSGSMGPKVQAAVEFVRGGGFRAGIGALADAAAIVEAAAGTVVEQAQAEAEPSVTL